MKAKNIIDDSNFNKPLKYKEMCKLMKVEEKSGKSRQLQLNEWRNEYNIDKDGTYYYIRGLKTLPTNIYMTPLTYEEMCTIMEDEPVKNVSTNRKNQLRKWQQYYDIEKYKSTYIIKRKYDENEKLERKMLRRYKYYECFAENYDENTIKKGGVYAIISNNDVYIGQTNNFNQRLSQHIITEYLSSNKFSITYDMLNNKNAKMTILEIEDDQEQRLTKETEYVYKFLEEGYNVVNSFNVLYRQDNQRKQKKSEYTMLRINKNQYDEVYELLQSKGYDILPLRKG